MPFKRPIVDTWHSDGAGSGRLPSVDRIAEVQPGKSTVAQSRSICSELRSRVELLLYSMIHLAGVKATDRHGKS